MRAKKAVPRACWCGSLPSGRFSEDYLLCSACGSLVLERRPEASSERVVDDERDFYGKSYYETHLPGTYRQPTLAERALSDLSERSVHWLRSLLQYRTPPADVLELGSGPGTFVALLHQAGFRATGLELSPTIVEFVRQAFGVPMLLGPITDHALPASSLDVLALMDVIEHFADPVATLSYSLPALREDGILLVQTPRFREELTFDRLQEGGDRFVEQLKPREHLFLFSERAIRLFFERLGVPHVVFEPALFSYYDMFLVASRKPLSRRALEGAVKTLSSSPGARMVRALIDADSDRRRLASALAAAEEDRAARLGVIEEQGRRLGEVEGERNTLAMVVEQARGRQEQATADLSARLQMIHAQAQRLGEVDGERNKLAQEVERLRNREQQGQQLAAELAGVKKRLEASEADRAARLKLIESQGRRLGELQGERNTLAMVVEQARGRIDQAQADLAARLQVINAQGQKLGAVEGERDRFAAEVAALSDRLARAEADAAAGAQALESTRAALDAAEREREQQAADLQGLRASLERSEADRAERVGTILEMGQRLFDLDGQRVSLMADLDALHEKTDGDLWRLSVLEREREAEAGQLEELTRRAGVLEEGVLAAREALWRSRERTEPVLEAYEQARAALLALRGSPAYRALRSLGRWAPLEEAVGRVIAAPSADEVRAAAEKIGRCLVVPSRAVEPAVPQEPPPAEADQADADRPDVLARRVLAACGERPDAFDAFERVGLHLTPVSFYSPIPDVAALAARPWPEPLPLEGVEMREQEQLQLLEACRQYEAEYEQFPVSEPDEAHRYYRDQPMFRTVDAEILHCLVRRNRPRRVIEIGSGFSTRVTAAALVANAQEGAPAEFLAIEPYPSDALRAGFPGLTELRVMDIQDLSVDFADGLEANDILFIDSTHVVRTGSDVVFLFLQVLPRLKPGVFVHVHDIFLPSDYPRQWVVDEHRFWTEQYLLHAFLLFNGAFQVEWAGNYMHQRHPEAVRQAFPAYDPSCDYPGSFWMRRMTPA